MLLKTFEKMHFLILIWFWLINFYCHSFCTSLLLIISPLPFLFSGSQAASLQADAPTQLEHARAALDVVLLSFKDSTKNIVNSLSDEEYGELK